MRRDKTRVLSGWIFLALVCCIRADAQSDPTPTAPASPPSVAFARLSVPPTVPDGEGAWTIQVATGGGLTGRGRGSATVTSVGELQCATLPNCSRRLAEDAMLPFTRFADSLDPSNWLLLQDLSVSLCNDCYTTTITFARRQNGAIVVSTISWSDVTRARVPAELLKLVDLALGLTR